jgi:hypothetical protein
VDVGTTAATRHHLTSVFIKRNALIARSDPFTCTTCAKGDRMRSIEPHTAPGTAAIPIGIVRAEITMRIRSPFTAHMLAGAVKEQRADSLLQLIRRNHIAQACLRSQYTPPPPQLPEKVLIPIPTLIE